MCARAELSPSLHAAAADARLSAAAALLLPRSLGRRLGTAADTPPRRVVPIAPDGLPLLGSLPDFDAGRVALLVADTQHALGLARTGAAVLTHDGDASCVPCAMR